MALPEASNSLDAPYSTALQTIPPHPQCPVCQRPNTEGIVVAKTAWEQVVSQAEAKPEVETGGVLIGFIDECERATVTVATEAGSNAVEKKRRFERDPEYMQKRLEEERNRLGEKGQYLGEWHSHLERNPSPSARDVEALTGISEAPHYLTSEPVMLIVGLDPDTESIENVHGSCFPLGQRFTKLDLQTAPDDDVLSLEQSSQHA